MPLKIEKEPKFWAKITVMTPVDDGHREDDFRVRFAVQPASDVEEVLAGTIKTDDFLRKAITDVAEVLDDEDNSIPFSATLRDQLIGSFHARHAMFNAYLNAISKVRAGN